MKKLDISITKAQLTSYTVSIEDDGPVVSASLALMTPGGKVVTSYSVSSHSWKSDPLDVPITALPLMGELGRIIERAAVAHCRDSQLTIAAPKQKVTADDTAIDLDNIPF
jgi:hypothetical protein